MTPHNGVSWPSLFLPLSVCRGGLNFPRGLAIFWPVFTFLESISAAYAFSRFQPVSLKFVKEASVAYASHAVTANYLMDRGRVTATLKESRVAESIVLQLDTNLASDFSATSKGHA